ncbi:excinuclease ABC subunit UvrC [Temperatibacter marinus]|uniref:UvrABC system protein C n=1 Tax=Temperatibacter marinus TaxID=1456591 RepID=A0AA52EF19_9PROT|nr:excinuclease ABC subunit UvrC [Temperatibacter marinus]WND01630.1 excinuclease ABC subunit UvrC [Temperatibacter marinus]
MSKNQTSKPTLEAGIKAIKTALKTAPSKPGVYRMLDKNDDILYVGKAKDIKKRVTSYTRANNLNNRLVRMVSHTLSMVFVTTTTEAEALLLEASLIKRYFPPYNVLLKDDKSFPYILLRTDHTWAQITKHRGARKNKGIYFGPFASVNAVNKTLNILQKVFQLRSCTDSTLETRSRACLLHQIKRCSAPCVDKISKADYGDMVHETQLFLEGKDSSIQKKFAESMQRASESMEYEIAAIFRDRLHALTQVQSHQSMVNAMVDEADIIAAAQIGGKTCIQMFFFRAGQNWGHRAYFPKHDKEEKLDVVLSAFIAQFYENKPVPKQLIVSHDSEDMPLLAEALSEKAGRKVKIEKPQRGKKAETIKEAMRNATEALERKLAESASQRNLLAGLAKILDLEESPTRIEIYDNSHIQGNNAVGGMVVAGPDGFMKNSYRKFNIKDEEMSPGDDFGMMREVMLRRFKRLISEDEDKSRGHWPDILLIDGGKGQLSSVHDVLDDMGIEETDVLVVAISKGPDRNAGREQFHIRGRDPFMLPLNDPVLYYLQRLRDEAHRFAIGSHRARRSKDIKKSPLDSIPGVGPKRKKALLNHFGSAKAIIGAHKRDLEAVEGVSKAMAQQIYDYFQQT